MQIRWAKGSAGKPNVLTCFRDDGTATWGPLGDFLPLHDMTHYAVETTLGCRDAFYGLVAQGWDLRDFSDKARDPKTGGVVKSVLPQEALAVEWIVGTLDRVRETLGMEAEPAVAAALFEEMLAPQREQLPFPLPTITTEQVLLILAKRQKLTERWQRLSPGEFLELEF